MKVTVIKNLNVRVGKPSLNAPCYQYLAPGSILEVDGKLYTGDLYDGNDQWYRDEANNYYWSGGVNGLEHTRNLVDFNSAEQAEIIKIEDYINLETELPNGQGENTNLAILDSGIDLRYEAFSNAIIQDKNKDFIHEAIHNSHGTLVTGLIIGDGIKIQGLASATKIIDLRIANNNSIANDDAVFYALKYIVEDLKKDDIHVINMSFDTTPALITHLQPLVNKLHERGSVIVCAGTKKGTEITHTNISKLNNTIKVGVFSPRNFRNLQKNGIDSRLSLAFLNRDLPSTLLFPNITNSFRDSSAYTALTTGILLKYISSENIPTNKRFEKSLEFLKNCALSVIKETTAQPFKPYI